MKKHHNDSSADFFLIRLLPASCSPAILSFTPTRLLSITDLYLTEKGPWVCNFNAENINTEINLHTHYL